MQEDQERFSERNKVFVQIDHDICAGFGDCVDSAPEAFALNGEDLAIVIDPDAVDIDALKEAADVCPVSAILLFDESGIQVAPEI